MAARIADPGVARQSRLSSDLFVRATRFNQWTKSQTFGRSAWDPGHELPRRSSAPRQLSGTTKTLTRRGSRHQHCRVHPSETSSRGVHTKLGARFKTRGECRECEIYGNASVVAEWDGEDPSMMSEFRPGWFSDVPQRGIENPLIAGLMIGVFGADLLTPPDVVIGLLYPAVLLYARPRSFQIVLLVSLAVVLTTLAGFSGPARGSVELLWINRVAVILCLIACGLALWAPIPNHYWSNPLKAWRRRHGPTRTGPVTEGRVLGSAGTFSLILLTVISRHEPVSTAGLRHAILASSALKLNEARLDQAIDHALASLAAARVIERDEKMQWRLV